MGRLLMSDGLSVNGMMWDHELRQRLKWEGGAWAVTISNAQVKVGMLRMIFFLCVFFFNLLLTYVDVPPEYKLEIRNNIRWSLNEEAMCQIVVLIAALSHRVLFERRGLSLQSPVEYSPPARAMPFSSLLPDRRCHTPNTEQCDA